MSLGVITIAFVPIAVLFVAAGMAAGRWDTAGPRPGTGGLPKGTGPGGSPDSGPPAPGPVSWGALGRAVWLPAAAEALVLTLFAALWFGSLGHGGWVLLFLLLGALVSGADRWTRRRLAGAPPAHDARWFVVGLLKYLAAGAACSWLLS